MLFQCENTTLILGPHIWSIKQIFSNGGEFENKEFVTSYKDLNQVCTTAAKIPWSNRPVERHNVLLGKTASNVKKYFNCQLETVVACAKNCLKNVYGLEGFSNLALGRNPNYTHQV